MSSANKRKLVTGYDRSKGGLTKAARHYEKQNGNRVMAVPPALKRLIAASKETGYLDTALAGYACDTTGSLTLLNAVPQGAAVTQRIGKKIEMKSLQARGIVQNGTTAIVNDIAYLIVYDKRPTGTLPAITDVLVSVSSFSMNNDNNSGRFKIVKRVDQNLIGNAGALTESTAQDADWFCSLKGLETVYKALGTGAIADIEQGALYLITVGNVAAGTAAATLFESFRLRFMDT